MIAADRGLVLRSYKLRETSKIVSILGFERGRVRLVAHGGRATASGFGASLEIGNELEFVYSQTPGRELGTLREATLRRTWLAGSRRLEPLGVGMAIVELLDRHVPEGATEPDLGLETVQALATLAAVPGRAEALLLFYAWELRLLARLGLRPELGACARCGRPAGESPGRLDVAAGAIACRQCLPPGPGRVSLPSGVALLLSALARSDWSTASQLPSTPRERRLVGLCLHRLLGMHLDRYRYPKSLALLKKVDVGTTRPGSAASGEFPTPA